eukprot:COSAG06_NODE_1916_length_8071_cov_3.562970_1_plen_139_part_10
MMRAAFILAMGAFGGAHSATAQNKNLTANLRQLQSTEPTVCGEGEGVWDLQLLDSFGDGWNGNTLTVTDCEGTVLESAHTIVSGDTHAVDICLAAGGGYIVSADGGTYASEISWTLADPDGTIVMEGAGTEEVSTCNCG